MQPALVDNATLAKILVSLRKSMVRRLVLSYLSEIYPRGSYINEIAKRLALSPTQVYGAIKGLRNHYEPKDSLLNLGLVEPIDMHTSRVTWYRATKIGCQVINMLKSNQPKLSWNAGHYE